MSDDPSKQPNAEAVPMPMDCPAYLTAYRLVEEGEELEMLHKGGGQLRPSSRSIKGHTIEINCYTYGVTIYVRLDRIDGTLKVFSDDGNGPEKLAQWNK